GRLGPGVCYRLHTREEERGVVDFEEPEILRTDATPALLDVLLWSGRDPALFPWFEAPGSAALSAASALLRRMGALAETGWALTEKGRAIARMPVSPRLAATVLSAAEQGRGTEGALLAALVEERDVKRRTFGTGPEPAVNVEDRAVEVREAGKGSAPEFDRGALLRVFRLRDRLSRQLPGTRAARAEARPVLLAGFPDRVARVDASRGEAVLEGGRRLAFRTEHEAGAPLILVLDTAGGETSPERVTLFAPLAIADLPLTREEVAVFWDSESLSVRAEKRLVFGALTLDERPVPAPANEAAAELLAKAALERGLRDFTNLAELERLEARLAFLARALPEVSFTEVSRETLLREAARGKRRLDELGKSRLDELLLESLNWEERRLLSAEAPEAIAVPSGRSHAVDYTPDGPVLAVKLQELFGLAETPRLARGRVPVILHLLSPARRPVQVTRDLRSFWSTTYHEVRKELRGRYPKHPWPEDPWNAPPTHRATRRPTTGG
ncbi:MAG: ATP-dependent helicase HrpB, partial [Acidobacteria bacterium]|nr:ATP-dependent helicase HrpB [Acidobacteriota bacterium]